MKTTELLAAYQKLKLPEMMLKGLNAQSQTINSPADALTWFLSQKPQSGWLQLQQKDIAFTQGDLSAIDNPKHGFLMQAEAMLNDTSSISIRYNGKDGYLATTFNLTNGDTHMMDTVTLLGTAKAPGKSRYVRVWDMESKRPTVAIFNGFEGI
jgi:hypothetical protein